MRVFFGNNSGAALVALAGSPWNDEVRAPADSVTAVGMPPTVVVLPFQVPGGDPAQLCLREAISRNPASLEARVYLAAVLESDGDRDGAHSEAEEIRATAPDFSTPDWLETYPMTDADQAQQLKTALTKLGL